MIKIAEVLNPQVDMLWTLARQCGLSHVVGTFDWSKGLDVPKDELPWGYMSLVRLKTAYANGGFELEVLENFFRERIQQIKMVKELLGDVVGN